ncbi:MAG: hypothetical protein IPJ49_26300 [Candidatus Obscuribacter sp.]|nr:hypothetical protein [Candidatus Obscuribacter sp.]
MKLKLSHTLFLLVAVPLFFELFFVGSLYVLLEQVEQERSREAHAREISKHLNALHQILLSGIAYTSGDAVQGLYHKSETTGLSDYMFKEFEILKELTKGNVEEAQHVERDQRSPARDLESSQIAQSKMARSWLGGYSRIHGKGQAGNPRYHS